MKIRRKAMDKHFITGSMIFISNLCALVLLHDNNCGSNRFLYSMHVKSFDELVKMFKNVFFNNITMQLHRVIAFNVRIFICSREFYQSMLINDNKSFNQFSHNNHFKFLVFVSSFSVDFAKSTDRSATIKVHPFISNGFILASDEAKKKNLEPQPKLAIIF